MQTDTSRKGQSFQLPGTIVTLLAIAADTGDSFSLFDARVAPQQGIPLHRHTDDEAFLVVEGTFYFQIEDQHLSLGPGGFAFVPRHQRHRYFNSHAELEGHLLVSTLPAGYHERFFCRSWRASREHISAHFDAATRYRKAGGRWEALWD